MPHSNDLSCTRLISRPLAAAGDQEAHRTNTDSPLFSGFIAYADESLSLDHASALSRKPLQRPDDASAPIAALSDAHRHTLSNVDAERSVACSAASRTPPATAQFNELATRLDLHEATDGAETLQLSCDGADARYVEVANERAFSALPMRSRTCDDGDVHAAFENFSRCGYQRPSSTSLLHAPEDRQGRDRATSVTLTRVRGLPAGVAASSHLHTPQHSTAYGSRCYHQLLSNALLGGSTGHTSVFSLSTRTTPSAMAQRAQPPRTADEATRAATPRGSEVSCLGTAERPVVDAFNNAAGAQAGVPLRRKQDKGNDGDSDSSAISICSSPQLLTTGDGREEEEEEEDQRGVGSGHDAARILYAAEGRGGTDLRSLSSGAAKAAATAAPPAFFTSPLMYFQHAPSVWAGENSPTARQRHREPTTDSAVVLNGAASLWKTGAALPSPALRPSAPMPSTTPFSSSVLRSADATPARTGAADGCETPLFAPAEPVHLMSRMVDASCTPPSIHGADDLDGDALFPASAEWTPTLSSTGAARQLGFCTPRTSRPTFVLPSSTACEGHPYPISDSSAVCENAFHATPCRCTTPPLPPYGTEGFPISAQPPRGFAARDASVSEGQQTPARTPSAVADVANGTSDAAYGSLRTSPASIRRPAASSTVLSTPVRHHDNSIHDFNSIHSNGLGGGHLHLSPFPHRGNGPAAVPFSAASPSTRFPASPAAAAAATPATLSPAHHSVRYGASAVASVSGDAGATSRRHVSPYREVFRSSSRTGIAHGAAHGHGAAPAAAAHRDAFHFQRAMTASETSTDPLHSPFFWGCFGVLVAQKSEVWCVGKAQPFRIFPHALEGSAAMCALEGSASVTAVASTTVVSAASWEEAAIIDERVAEEAENSFGPIAPASPTARATAFAQDIVYLAVGTSTGDVCVYAYGRCAAAASGSLAISLSSARHDGPHLQEQQETSTHAVKLHRCGTLTCANRVGDASRSSSELCGFTTHPTSASSSPASEMGNERCAITVLRIVGSWLYVGDLGGHVARYDLRLCTFLHKAEELHASPRQGLPPSESAPSSPPLPTARPSGGEARTPARLPASPNPRMPVHSFARPTSVLSIAASAKTAGTGQATTISPKPPQQSPSHQNISSFHFAVQTGEPVYNIEVTDNHSYLAVGTQTRLLIYRVAEMRRVADASTASAPSSALRSPPSATSKAAVARTPSPVSVGLRSTPRGNPVESTAPLVVVRDAPQPIRCFAWMLCDYEDSTGIRPNREWEEGQAASSMAEAGEASAYDGAMGVSCSLSSIYHTPTPSLVFASCSLDAGDAVLSSPRTELHLFRVVTQSVAASCMLDYPVRMLKVVAGTTQLVVATGSAAEWGDASRVPTPLPSPGSPWTGSPNVHALTPTQRTLPSAVQPTQSRSPSVSNTPHPSLSPLLARSPVPLNARRQFTPLAASVVAAVRTLSGHSSRPLPGWGLRGTTFALRPTTRIGHTSVYAGSPGRATPTGTPDLNAQTQRPHAALPREAGHGFLFRFEVRSCAPGVDGREIDGSRGVYFRARGESVVGDGESAVSGYLSPTQEQVSVLVQPTAGSPRSTGAANALSVKVKVWGLMSSGRHESARRPTPTSYVAPFASMAHPTESLR